MRIGESTVAIVKFITDKDRGPTVALKMVRHQLMLLGEYMWTNWFGQNKTRYYTVSLIYILVPKN